MTLTQFLESMCTSSFDLSKAKLVHVVIDENSEGVQLWVDVDGHNRGRIYRIENLVITDRRQEKTED